MQWHGVKIKDRPKKRPKTLQKRSGDNGAVLFLHPIDMDNLSIASGTTHRTIPVADLAVHHPYATRGESLKDVARQS